MAQPIQDGRWTVDDESPLADAAAEKSLTDKHVKVLTSLGMPEPIALSVQKSRGFTPRMTAVTGLITLAILLFAIGVAVWLLGKLPVAEWYVGLGLVSSETLLIDSERAHALGFIFGAIAAAGVLTNMIAASHKQLAIKTAITSIQKYLVKSPSWSHRLFPGIAIHGIDPTLSRNEYLVRYVKADARFAFWVLVAISFLTSLCFMWDGSSATCATPEGVLIGSRLPGNRRFVTWDQVQKLSTGSFWQSNRTVRNLRYVIHLPDDTTIDFSDSISFDPSGRNLNALLAVDEKLRKLNVPWERATFPAGIHAGQVQWDESCFESAQSELSDEERQKFRRIYHLDEGQ